VNAIKEEGDKPKQWKILQWTQALSVLATVSRNCLALALIKENPTSADYMRDNETHSTETCQTIHLQHHLKTNTGRCVCNQDTQLDRLFFVNKWSQHGSTSQP